MNEGFSECQEDLYTIEKPQRSEIFQTDVQGIVNSINDIWLTNDVTSSRYGGE